MNTRIDLTPLSERPRERCLTNGAHCLSLRECLALILGSGPPGTGCLGLANRILEHPGKGLHGDEMERAFFTAIEISGSSYLKEIEGLGPAGQAKILASFEIGRRYSHFRNQVDQKTQSKNSRLPALAYEALARVSVPIRSDPEEWLGFVPLYRTGQIGMFNFVEKGVRTHVNIDPAELFARVLVLRPEGFFLFHNHPSGNLRPSVHDLDLTEKVSEIAQQFGIYLLGHWIVSLKSEYWINPNQDHLKLNHAL